MTLPQTIVEIDSAAVEVARLAVIYAGQRDAAAGAGDLVSRDIFANKVVVCDAVSDALRRARDGCEELT